jgi:hypothetical protein
MDNIEEFINQEETLKVMASSRLHEELAPAKKKKKVQES